MKLCFLFAFGLMLGFIIGNLTGYEMRKGGERLAGDPFMVASLEKGAYLCIAEFDSKGNLVRRGEK